MDETLCRNCDRPIVNAGPDPFRGEWVHRPIEPEAYAFYYCTIEPGVPLSSNPHASPMGD